MKMIDKNTVVMRARALSRSPTLSESLLWRILRTRPEGLKFRRQHPFGPFILDFYCAATRTAVEVDGESHDLGDRAARDARRDAWLRGQGLRVPRFNAADVVKDLESVMTAIRLAARR